MLADVAPSSARLVNHCGLETIPTRVSGNVETGAADDEADGGRTAGHESVTTPSPSGDGNRETNVVNAARGEGSQERGPRCARHTEERSASDEDAQNVSPATTEGGGGPDPSTDGGAGTAVQGQPPTPPGDGGAAGTDADQQPPPTPALTPQTHAAPALSPEPGTDAPGRTPTLAPSGLTPKSRNRRGLS